MMDKPSLDAIEMFMSITGAFEAVAAQTLQVHNGDLNSAVNSYFCEGDRRAPARYVAGQVDFMDIDDPVPVDSRQPPSSLWSEARERMNPFSILDSTIYGTRSPFSPPSIQSDPARRIRDASDACISDGKDDTSIDPTIQATSRGERSGRRTRERLVRASAPEFDQYQDNGNDIEEEMIQAAIEASRRETEEGFTTLPFSAQNTAEQEITLREKGGVVEELKEGTALANEVEMRKIRAIIERYEAGLKSTCNADEDSEEKPLLLRHESRGTSSGTNGPAKEAGTSDISPSSSQTEHDTQNSSQHNENDEWGGISSEEHDEAVMLEAAMFGGISDGRGYHFARAPYQIITNDDSSLQPFPRAPSPSLIAQRVIREQQDDEYLAALEADREKELKAMEEAEARRQEARQKEEESSVIREQQQELERQLTAKEASLPDEPSLDDENAVTLHVRMPNGSRRGRKFLKHDRLQFLFDFIDINRVFKPGSYRLVRPYPRRTFSDGERGLTLSELGLTSKQEALFLELI